MEKILGSLLVLGLALPWYFTQKATGSLPAGCLAGLGGLAVTVAFLWWLSLQRDRYQADAHRRRDLKYAKSGLRAIDRMSGTEFEEFVAAQLRIAGYSVAPTASTGDYGVDLIAKKDRGPHGGPMQEAGEGRRRRRRPTGRGRGAAPWL